ncbi:MAG: GNAT family N-acetyltransferase [Pseudomonadota bacterium]|nr:GNAT family N-acetyltransferase [Pseudomonadota bacterium]
MTDVFHEAAADAPAERTAALLARCEPLHRQLRPHLPADYPAWMQKVFADGAGLCVLESDGRPRALGLWRAYHTTYAGRRFYVDDLVAEESERGKGWGGKMLAHLESKARALDCDVFALDSGVQRNLAHRFYFRAGLTIIGFSFARHLTQRFR